MTRALWVDLDWSAPEPAAGVLEAYLRAARPRDAVQLALPSGALTEADALARLMTLLQEVPEFRARGAALPDITLHEGAIPPGAEVLGARTAAAAAAAMARLHDLRRELAAFVAVTPVMDREAWAAAWTPEPGFHHLAVDNASGDATAARLRAAGADVVVQPRPVGRVGNWQSALQHARDRTPHPWIKWLFAGDELLPGAADALQDAASAHPEARLIVAEYVMRHPDGREQRYREFDHTRLIEPAEALERSAVRGNWFGSPIGHAVHRDVVDDVEFGSQPWVADWQACVSIARRHPVLYVAEVVGVFDIGSRAFYGERLDEVHSLVQELSLRQQSLEALRAAAPDRPDLDVLAEHVDVHAARALSERVAQRHASVGVGT
jgi:hypothetical protein